MAKLSAPLAPAEVHAFNGRTAARVIVYKDRAITAACAGDVAFMVPPVPATLVWRAALQFTGLGFD